MTAALLAIGLTTLDINAYPVDELTHTERASLIKELVCAPAGTAAGMALVAARLGVSTALAGAVGDDMNGLFVRAGLESLGVDTRLLVTRAGEPTSSTLLAVEVAARAPAFTGLARGDGRRSARLLSPPHVRAGSCTTRPSVGRQQMEGQARNCWPRPGLPAPS